MTKEVLAAVLVRVMGFSLIIQAVLGAADWFTFHRPFSGPVMDPTPEAESGGYPAIEVIRDVGTDGIAEDSVIHWEEFSLPDTEGTSVQPNDIATSEPHGEPFDRFYAYQVSPPLHWSSLLSFVIGVLLMNFPHRLGQWIIRGIGSPASD